MTFAQDFNFLPLPGMIWMDYSCFFVNLYRVAGSLLFTSSWFTRGWVAFTLIFTEVIETFQN